MPYLVAALVTMEGEMALQKMAILTFVFIFFTSPTTTVRNKPFPVLTNQRKTTARRHLLAGTQRSPQACRQNTNSTPYGIRWKCLEVLFGLTRQLRAPRPPP